MKLQTFARCVTALAAFALVAACGGKGEPAPASAPAPAPAVGGEAADEAKPDEAKPAPASGEVVALKAIATTVIKAFAAKDINALAEFAPAEAQAVIKEMKPGNPQFDNLFDESKWRWKAASGWDGAFGAVRLDGDDKAWLKFADLPDDEVAVVKLRKHEGKWLFDDFGSPSKERFEGWGAEAK